MPDTPENTPDPAKKRRGRVGKAVKKDTVTPAEFIPAGEEWTPPEETGDAVDSPPSHNVVPFVLPDSPVLTADEIAMLGDSEAQELNEARAKLKARAKLTAREKALLKKAAAPPVPEPNQSREWESFNPDKLCDSLNAWWVNGAGSNFQIRDQSDAWLQVPETMILTALARRGVPSYPVGGESLSRRDQLLMHIREKRTLDNAIRGVAGYQAGVHEIKGARVLVRQGPRLIVPVPGEWNTIELLIKGLLMLEDGGDDGPYVQIDRFHFWMSRAVENVYNSPGVRLNSQILILAGPAKSGKSRLQHMVITPLLGGRSADPSRYLFGETTFNSNWMGKEHLLIEDPRPSMKMLDRLQLAQHLKGLCVNEDHSFHAKGNDEFEVDAEFVVSISINNDPDALRILPPLTPDIIDKIMLLNVNKVPMPMPTRTPSERLAFQKAIRDELPAYLHFLLNECAVPELLQDERFGVLHYQEPGLKLVLWEDSPASELLALIDEANVLSSSYGGIEDRRGFFETSSTLTGEECIAEYKLKKEGPAMRLQALALAQNKKLWVGTYQELQSQLETCQHRGIAKKLLDHNAVPRLLSRLAEDYPDRVANYRANTARLWFILSPLPVAQVAPAAVDV